MTYHISQTIIVIIIIIIIYCVAKISTCNITETWFSKILTFAYMSQQYHRVTLIRELPL